MFQIRLATVADVPALTPLVEQYRAFYKQESNPNTESYLAQRIANQESIVFVADDHGTLVGFTQCYPTFSTVSLSQIWLLNDLFVAPEHRGKHIADQLMSTAEASAKDSGATRIWLRTAHTNSPAQALYEGRGWMQDEIYRRYDLIF
jgi:ribosomal protein S18 acetylase RimI-like enzyme